MKCKDFEASLALIKFVRLFLLTSILQVRFSIASKLSQLVDCKPIVIYVFSQENQAEPKLKEKDFQRNKLNESKKIKALIVRGKFWKFDG